MRPFLAPFLVIISSLSSYDCLARRPKKEKRGFRERKMTGVSHLRPFFLSASQCMEGKVYTEIEIQGTNFLKKQCSFISFVRYLPPTWSIFLLQHFPVSWISVGMLSIALVWILVYVSHCFSLEKETIFTSISHAAGRPQLQRLF